MHNESIGLPHDAEMVRAWAFTLLLATHEPVSLAQLATPSGMNVAQLEASIQQLEREGRLRRVLTGRVIGSAGLNLDPTRHQMRIDGAVWWTWWAFDALGILAALDRGGLIESTCAQSGVPLTVQFIGAEPSATEIAIFIADEEVGGSLIDDWCPKNSFFCTTAAARDWAATCGTSGRVVSLQDGAKRAAERWRRCLALTATNSPGA